MIPESQGDLLERHVDGIVNSIREQRSEVGKAISMALSTLDIISVAFEGSLFTSIPLEARRRVLVKLEESRLKPLRSLSLSLKSLVSSFFYDIPEISRRLGWTSHCSEPLMRIDKDEVKDGKYYRKDVRILSHVIVIGSGAGGAVIAKKLAKEGLSVTILEEGGFYTAEEYGVLTPMESVFLLYRDAGATFTSFGIPQVLIPVGRCVGGSTVVNTGVMERMDLDLLDTWKKKYGIELQYEALEKYYAEVEEELGVKEVPDKLLGRVSRILREGAKKLGLESTPLKRNANSCKGCGRCFLGCQINAKSSMNVSLVPAAIEQGATLYTRFRAEKISRSSGRWMVFGKILDENMNPRAEFIAESDVLILSAGSIFTPLILKNSGFKHPALGNFLKVHPSSRVISIFEDEDVKVELSEVPQGYGIRLPEREIQIDGIRLPPSIMSTSLPGFAEELSERMSKYVNTVVLTFRIIDEGTGRVTRRVWGFPLIRYSFEGIDKFRFLNAMKLVAKVLFEAGAKEILLPVKGIESIKDPARLDEISVENTSTRYFQVSGYHLLGTCRMARESSGGIVDMTGRVFGEQRLFIADASVFPDSPLVPPQLTTMVFSSMCADYIVEHRARILGSQKERMVVRYKVVPKFIKKEKKREEEEEKIEN